jgi:hypothetical protein
MARVLDDRGTLATILQRLDHLTATVTRLEAIVTATHAVPRPHVDTIDRETLSLLAQHVGEHPFTARDVSALAGTVPDLAHALDDVASLSPLAIGLWLTRMATTTTAGGSRLTFQERGRDGNIWQFA